MRKNEGWPLGHHKIKIFLEDLLTRDDFLSDIKKMREQFNIPDGGYATNKNKRRTLSHWPVDFEEDTNRKIDFINVLKSRFGKYGIGPLMSATAPLRYIIFYDCVRLPEYYDLCAIEDRRYPNKSKNHYGECLYDDSTHPITIRISPEAKSEDIVDFVRRNYKGNIKPLQILYRKQSGIGTKRFRTPESLMISDIIASNLKKSNKEIKNIIQNKGIKKILNLSEIATKKKIEKQRRKKTQ